MKMIRKGLMALAFSGLSCSAVSLQDFKNMEKPSEDITVKVDSAFCGASHLHVYMDPIRYKISCDEDFYFTSDGKSDYLKCDNVTFHDPNGDGNVDYFYYGNDFVRLDENVYSHSREKYREMVEDFRKEEIQEIWKNRWNRD